MQISECFELGVITKIHGIKGEIVAEFKTDSPEFKKLESVFLLQKNGLVPFFISKISVNDSRAIIKLEDIDSEKSALFIKGCKLYLPLAMLPDAEEDAPDFTLLIGFHTEDENLGPLGQIMDFYDMPMNELIGIDHLGKEILVPVRSNFITKIEKRSKKVWLNLPDGYLDIYLDTKHTPDDGD